MTRSDDRSNDGGDDLAPVTYLASVRRSTRSSDHPAVRAQAARAESATGESSAAGSAAAGSRAADSTAAISRAFGLDAVPDHARADDDLAVVDDSCLTLETRDVALRALGRKALSQRELERLLVGQGYPESMADDVVEGLKQDGFVDDSALAQDLVGRLQERKGLGRSGVAAELTRRLLAPAAISYALELIDTGDELARAREVARKRASQLGGLDRETAVRRLSGYLQRRGYSGSAVRSAVESALPATGTVGRGPRFE